jgi:hypothetical protein
MDKAAALLMEEVEKRTRIHWRLSEEWPDDDTPVIVLGLADEINALGEQRGLSFAIDREALGSEGYQIGIEEGGQGPIIRITGLEFRGVLFGAGRLLRELRMAKRSIRVSSSLKVTSAPHYSLRGHQLGYRPKTNSYDGWSLPIWEQYIRDLIVFGTNAVELIPPRSDDDADSPHFPLPPMEMMIGMSQILDDYDLDVWVWYPAMDADYSDPNTVEFALAEWEDAFRQLPRINAIFVPGGDPGHSPPKHLMALLERQTESLHRHHPDAEMWVSPQGFHQEWMDEFLTILRDEQPNWLSGVVYGPQVRGSLRQLREAVPSRYALRNYPDITHTRQCQYPVPGWDPAFAYTLGREPINPRPLDQTRLFQLMGEDTVGFLTYSEGCNDDVNKFIWSALGWNPEADSLEILRQYSRYFIGESYAEGFARGLLALEGNWRGPLLSDESVYVTLQQFQDLERSATPQDRLNWRFQQALYRAYYDATLRSRLIYETELEERAMERLRQARSTGSLLALSEAEEILDRAQTHRVALDWRARVFEYAEALFQSIRMQLSVDRYAAIAVERGANLDSIDVPLNNRLWLKERFEEIRSLPTEAERLEQISRIVNWTNPGPGGFYDNLGRPHRQPRLITGKGFEEDPAFHESPRTGFAFPPNGRVSWRCHAEALYDLPLEMIYTRLDSSAQYQVKVLYAGDSPQAKVRLAAIVDDREIEIHPYRPKDRPIQPLTFDLPGDAIQAGELRLKWQGEPGLGGNGRRCQVSEVWLIKKA